MNELHFPPASSVKKASLKNCMNIYKNIHFELKQLTTYIDMRQEN